MSNKKQILTAIIAVLISVGLVATAVYATTTVGNDVSVGGDLDIVGTDLQATTGTLNISKTGSMTTIKGTFNVDEAVTLDSTIAVTGATTLNGNVTLGNAVSDTLTVWAPLVWAATTTTYGIDLNAATSSTADIRLQNGETIDNATDGYIGLSSAVTINPTRTAGQYWNAMDISDGGDGAAFTAETPAKTYIYNTEVRRLATTDMTGDSRDVMFKGVYRNYGQNDASSNAHGLGVSVRNESGGTMGTMKGIESGVNNKSGAYATTVRAADFTVENYGFVNVPGSEFGGLRIDLRNEGAVATTEYGIHITNSNNSLATAVDTGILLSDSGANVGWTYGIDMNGATIATADIRLSDSSTIASGSIDGTTLRSIVITPKASTTTASISYHELVRIPMTFGDADHRTYGLALSGSRSGAANSGFDGTDTSLDIRATNAEANNAAYKMQGMYIKAKNSSGGTVGNLTGAKIEIDSRAGSTVTNIKGLEVYLSQDAAGVSGSVIGINITDDNQDTTSGTYYGLLINTSGGYSMTRQYGIYLDSDSGSWTNALSLDGTITNVLDFAEADGTNGAKATANNYVITSPTTSDAIIKIDIAGTSYWIPAYDAASVTNE